MPTPTPKPWVPSPVATAPGLFLWSETSAPTATCHVLGLGGLSPRGPRPAHSCADPKAWGLQAVPRIVRRSLRAVLRRVSVGAVYSQNRDWYAAVSHVRFAPKADIRQRIEHVCLVPCVDGSELGFYLASGAPLIYNM
jgi:hypothetical protein